MERVEREAERVLSSVPSWLWDGEQLPVPVEDIADSVFGLLVRDVDDLAAAPGAPDVGEGESLSGLLLASRGEIWVNAAEARQWPPRRRFTIGHELGHWTLHQDGQVSLFCRSTSVAEGQQRPSLPVIEEEASAFAAALLMPEHLMQIHWLQTGEDLERMCELFSSSRAAMERRVRDLFGDGALD
jgi:hypothetical protein